MNGHRVVIAFGLALLFSIVRCPELSSHQDKRMGLAVVPYSRMVSPYQRNSINPVGGAQSIRPGLGIGLLELGDTRSRALELFKPDADRDISVPFGCGSRIRLGGLGKPEGWNRNYQIQGRTCFPD